MRSVDVTTDTFALIWRLRLPTEQSENEVIRRVFSDWESQRLRAEQDIRMGEADAAKVRWVDDVISALKQLGGTADLIEIYRVTRTIRSNAGRTVPRTLEATIRRTLEDHSSNSANFRGTDIFRLVGRGRWALR